MGRNSAEGSLVAAKLNNKGFVGNGVLSRKGTSGHLFGFPASHC